MLPIKKLPVDVPGLTPDMKEELERRVTEFEQEHEPDIIVGGEGYVQKIKKGDILFAGVINAAIVVYMIVALLIM